MDKKIKIILNSLFFLIPLILACMGSLFLIIFYEPIFGYSITSGVLVACLIGCITIVLIFTGVKLLLNTLNSRKRSKTLNGVHYSISGFALVLLIFLSWLILPYVVFKEYATGPMLTWGSNQDPRTEITLVWRSRRVSTATIHYGTEYSNLNNTVLTLTAEKWHKVSISGLEPNTKYYYQIDRVEKSRIFNFVTAPDVNKPFTFLCFGDPRQNSGQIGMLLERNVPKYMVRDMEKQGIIPAFTICVGDTVSNALDEPLWESWFDDITTKSGLANYYPLQIAIGNHERHENCSGSIFADRYPYEYHPNFYYSFNYSYTHFLMLDPWNETSCWWGGLDSVQLAWAEQDLTSSSSMKYKVISLHPPPVLDGFIFEELQPLIDLCDVYDVDVVFFGHWHRFGHWNINGTIYVLNGVGGNNDPDANPSGFCQIDVTTTQMEIDMHWLNGTNQAVATILA